MGLLWGLLGCGLGRGVFATMLCLPWLFRRGKREGSEAENGRYWIKFHEDVYFTFMTFYCLKEFLH